MTDAVPSADAATPRPLDEAAIHRLVHAFYDDVRADASLGPVFDAAIGDGWALHLDRMVAFWSTVMLGTQQFRGNVFGRHMALGGQVTGEHFLRWLTLWHRHTDRLFPPGLAHEFQRTAHGVGRNLFHGFFGRLPEFVVEDGVAVGLRPEAPLAP